MAFSEQIADRLREMFYKNEIEITERHMFGGIAFMYKGKMCCGVVKDEMMVRVVNEKMESVLEQPYVREMDFTKRPMKGFVFVEVPALKTDTAMKYWIELGIEHVENQLK